MTSQIPKESFIPLSRFALIDLLTNQVDNSATDEYKHFFLALGALRHLHYRKKLQRFKELYLPFSPDRDTLQVLEYSDAQLADLKEELINELSALLTNANYSPRYRKRPRKNLCDPVSLWVAAKSRFK